MYVFFIKRYKSYKLGKMVIKGFIKRNDYIKSVVKVYEFKF